MEEPQSDRYKTCLELFILHNGRNLSLIEREMRELGFADFNRRILYSRKEDGKYKPGWVERFGWRQNLRSGDRLAGTALCPERFDENALDEIKRQLGGYAFSALYQQRPTPAEGGIFKRAWFTRFVERAPQGLKWKRGYDLAVSTKTSACYTASFRVAYDEHGNLYIADGFRRRIEYPEQRRYIVSRLLSEKDTEHGIERALHGAGIIQDLRKEPGIRGTQLQGVTVTTDKITRALKWAPHAEEGKVILVRGPWNQPFLDEVCSFPTGQVRRPNRRRQPRRRNVRG